MQILVGKEICRDLNEASRKEWLETNGIGGFAASTVIGMNTRRYHGLLVPATHPPAGRFVAVSSLQETVRIGNAVTELGCNQYAGAVHPQGHRYLEHFRLGPYPVFTYRIGDVEIEKQVFMVHGENTTVVMYGPVPRPLILEIRPLIAYRDYHHLTHQNPHIDGTPEIHNGDVRFTPYPGMPPFFIAHNADAFHTDGVWYYNFEYAVEIRRGLDCHEDLFSPGYFLFRLKPGESARLILSLRPEKIGDVDPMRESEIARRNRVAESAVPHDAFIEALVQAADAFVVQRRDGLSTVIAGYPWFSDWGRDTMISLPGLTLVTGRFAEARAILEAFARACDHGMIPNRFPDCGEQAEYNSVDATLWYFHAVDRYLAYTHNLKFVRERLWPVLTDILRWYCEGTRYGIYLDDGLLHAGEAGVQLTWMDAKVGDWVVTPRMGKPVEINALWYNALRVMQSLAETFGDPGRAAAYRDLALRAKDRFIDAFWNAGAGCLYDYIDGDYRDPAIRPNQIFALSLPHRMLSEDRERRILETVGHHLLTPLGLRSLAPGDPAYADRYGGDQTARDGAYHQGTVWSWLIGPFITAWVRLHGATPEIRREAMNFLAPFRRHLYDACLGQISEIFDGAPPHEPRGCFAQAWSVAEVLRAYVEDVLGRGPGEDLNL